MAALQDLLQLGHELRGVGAVDQPVVIGEAEEHHVPDRDRVVAVAVGDDDRALHDRLDVEDRHLALGDDRRADQRAEDAGVRDREGAARHLVVAERLRAGLVGEVDHRA
jgi:hypothetical protein